MGNFWSEKDDERKNGRDKEREGGRAGRTFSTCDKSERASSRLIISMSRSGSTDRYEGRARGREGTREGGRERGKEKGK